MSKQRKLPARLYIVRHARSLANESLEQAEAAGHETFELPMPEHLCPIVDKGHRQVQDLASWITSLPEHERPHKIVSSTHTRTVETAEGIVAKSGLILPVSYDERLVEKRWGVIGGLTKHGFHKRHPDEVARRARLGDFRYRPAEGGESLRDLKKRIKPALSEYLAEHAGQNLMLVTHSQVILVLRQLIEGLSEKQALIVDKRKIPNCSATVYVGGKRRLVLAREYFVAPTSAGTGE